MCVFTQVKNGTVQKGALNDFLMVFDLAYWEKKQTKTEAQNKMKKQVFDKTNRTCFRNLLAVILII